VFDDGFLKNTELGTYFFEVSAVYSGKDHAVLHQWVALTKSSGENRETIQGYLRLGLSITGPGDQQIKLDTTQCQTNESLVSPRICLLNLQ
jgi:hypothetical protein